MEKDKGVIFELLKFEFEESPRPQSKDSELYQKITINGFQNVKGEVFIIENKNAQNAPNKSIESLLSTPLKRLCQ